MFQNPREREGLSPSLDSQEEPNMTSPLFQYAHEPEEISPVLRYLQHPEEFTALHQQLLQPEEKAGTSAQESKELSPVLQYLQQLEEIGSNLLQWDCCFMSSSPGNASHVEDVIQVKTHGGYASSSRAWESGYFKTTTLRITRLEGHSESCSTKEELAQIVQGETEKTLNLCFNIKPQLMI